MEEAEMMAEKVKKGTGFSNVIVNDISPSIGTHAGPGTLGIIYYGEKRPAAK